MRLVEKIRGLRGLALPAGSRAHVLLTVAMSLASIGAIALTVYGVVSLTGITLRGNDSPPALGVAEPVGPPPSPVITGEPQELKRGPRPFNQITICVDYFTGASGATGSAEVARAVAVFRTLTDELVKEPLASQVETAGARVDEGCPEAPLAFTAGIRLLDPALTEGVYDRIPLVQEASLYELFVFVVPDAREIESVLGTAKRRLAAQERGCVAIYEHRCATADVTKALYVTPEELGDLPWLYQLLRQALGYAYAD